MINGNGNPLPKLVLRDRDLPFMASPSAVQDNLADMPQLCIGHKSPTFSSRVK